MEVDVFEPKVMIDFRKLLHIYVYLMNHPEVELLQLTNDIEEILVEAARDAVESTFK